MSEDDRTPKSTDAGTLLRRTHNLLLKTVPSGYPIARELSWVQRGVLLYRHLPGWSWDHDRRVLVAGSNTTEPHAALSRAMALPWMSHAILRVQGLSEQQLHDVAARAPDTAMLFSVDPVDDSRTWVMGPEHLRTGPDPLTCPRTVTDVRGMRVTITPGRLDESAVHLYHNGQCLALALAIARARPPMGIVVLAYETENGTGIQHAWADDGTSWYDVDGAHDPHEVRQALADGEFDEAGDDDGTCWHCYRHDELDLAAQETSLWIGRQHHVLATSMVKAVMAVGTTPSPYEPGYDPAKEI